MQIREMKAQDIPVLAEIEEKIFSQPWSAQAFTDALSDPNAVFLVAAEEPSGQPCAYVGMYVAADEGEITNVATDPAFRRKGCAEALMARIKEIGLQKGLTQLVLETRKSNEAAIALYEKTGFEIIGERKGFYRFPPEDAYVMMLRYV
ncbi:MAG: ribosomal protein S18-alanine N-acetyltransferase [Lachnospiraceae bacterium]|nr:ribosomal protein S18-alanine N-acetyltransferase [Lachnospiraceae bacterium]